MCGYGVPCVVGLGSALSFFFSSWPDKKPYRHFGKAKQVANFANEKSLIIFIEQIDIIYKQQYGNGLSAICVA